MAIMINDPSAVASAEINQAGGGRAPLAVKVDVSDLRSGICRREQARANELAASPTSLCRRGAVHADRVHYPEIVDKVYNILCLGDLGHPRRRRSRPLRKRFTAGKSSTHCSGPATAWQPGAGGIAPSNRAGLTPRPSSRPCACWHSVQRLPKLLSKRQCGPK